MSTSTLDITKARKEASRLNSMARQARLKLIGADIVRAMRKKKDHVQLTHSHLGDTEAEEELTVALLKQEGYEVKYHWLSCLCSLYPKIYWDMPADTTV
jgi:hypothetical protein